jgi:hypothetical protein
MVCTPNTLLLTLEELQTLTGYRTRPKMIEWLIRRHWVFEPPGRKGDIPKVARAYFEACMSGQEPTERRIRPNLDWLTKPGAK